MMSDALGIDSVVGEHIVSVNYLPLARPRIDARNSRSDSLGLKGLFIIDSLLTHVYYPYVNHWRPAPKDWLQRDFSLRGRAPAKIRISP